MAEFKSAYQHMLPHEGGYANVKGDRGGETYAGISRKYHPTWPGWKIVDKHKPLTRNEKIKSTELDQLKAQFYYKNFWRPITGDFIDSQRVAEFVFDWHVHSGEEGIKAIQKAIGVSADGKAGTVTVGALNAKDEADIMVILIEARKSFVQDIVRRNPAQKKFLAGWLNRIYSFA